MVLLALDEEPGKEPQSLESSVWVPSPNPDWEFWIEMGLQWSLREEGFSTEWGCGKEERWDKCS